MRQDKTGKRRLIIGAFALAAAPLMVASVAHACTSLINLAVSSKSGPAGVSVGLTGSNYRNFATAGPVEIRLDSRTGPVIASLATSEINPTGRTISLTAPVPADAAIGYHTFIATQHDINTGALLSGFPVRAAYKVTSAAAFRDAVSGSEPAASTEPSGTTAVTGAEAAPVGAASQVVPATPAAPVSPAVAAADPAPAASTSAAASTPAPGTDEPAARAASPTAAPAAAAIASSSLAVEAAAATGAPPAAAASSETLSLLPATSGSPSILPSLTLALGAAMVLLGLAAFWKSGRTVLVGRRLLA